MNENEPKNLSSLIIDAMRVKGITAEKLSALTGVSERPLTMLIEEKLDKLPPAPYVHGYLIKIAEVLGLDGKKLWEEYLKDNEAIRRSGERDELPKNRFATPHLNKKFIWLGILGVLLLAYVATRIIAFYATPSLEFTNLSENTFATSTDFKILGNVDPDAQLTLNNEEVYSDKTGGFEKNISLRPGFNPLIFKIKKPLSKEYTITKQIFYQLPENNQTTSTNL